MWLPGLRQQSGGREELERRGEDDMLNRETIIKLAVQHGFKVGRDAGGEYVAPKYEDAVGSLVALVQAAYALGQEAQQAEPSQWRNEVKQLVSKYWEIAFQEGKSGENLADQANDILCQLDALLAQQTAVAVPNGYQLVPTEPTPKNV
ncbi:hypothetical protein QF022_001302 [Vogesella perlucida]|nr:hypothetical protein [Vogesella perlucida]